MSFISRMLEAAKQLDAPPPDPWRKTLEDALRGVDAMSTVALLDLVGAPHNTKNGRRVALIMRQMNFIPIQSRRLMPGGHRSTVSRGWARPMRSLPTSKKVKPQQGTPSSRSNLATQGEDNAN
jgi:hypothetical protein